jgi:tRNA dimethylallyltransferase
VTEDLPLVVMLKGPTASGKTGLAVELVQALPLDIVSVDSAMVYRGMDIGTAKPDAETLRVAPHRLIDIRDPAESYSAAEFEADAQREIEAIHTAGRVPLLVGGTMLYFRTLEQGLAELPSADPEARARLEADAARAGWPAMHARLAAVDPKAAARIHPNDPQRIQRALEVYELTGTPLTELQAEAARRRRPWRLLKLILAPADRDLLRTRIERRFESMLAAGLLDEVRRLRARGDLHPDLPAMRAVGYRQAWAYLDGRLAADAWAGEAVTATRQYAKRQMTWFRAETDVNWLDPGATGISEKLRSLIARACTGGT